MTPDGENKNFDSVLELFNVKVEIGEKEIEERHKTGTKVLIDRMCIIGLITIRTFSTQDNRTFILGAFGTEVKRHGSWTQYLADKAEDKRLATEQIKSSIRTNNTTILILILTVVISGLGAWVSWLNYDFVKTHQEPSRTPTDSISNTLLEQQTEVLRDLRETLKNDSLDSKIKSVKK